MDEVLWTGVIMAHGRCWLCEQPGQSYCSTSRPGVTRLWWICKDGLEIRNAIDGQIVSHIHT